MSAGHEILVKSSATYHHLQKLIAKRKKDMKPIENRPFNTGEGEGGRGGGWGGGGVERWGGGGGGGGQGGWPSK